MTSGIISDFPPCSHAEFKQLLHYAPETGVFTWKASTSKHIKRVGKRAGSIGTYVVIGMFCRSYYAHRLAWFYVRAEWPKGQIDHKNRNKIDNRLFNLRDVTAAKNRQNRKLRPGQGVCWDAGKQRWYARIQIEGRTLNLGRYKSYKKALVVRKAAEKQHEFFPR